MELDLATVRRVTATMVRKYAKATRAEKSAMLGQLCEVNGWHRDRAGDPVESRTCGHG